MKVEDILLGRAIRLLRINSRPLYITDAVQPLVDRYKFLKFPQTLEEYDLTKGITFSHGKFQPRAEKNKRDVVIDSLQIYSNGVLVDTRGDTEDADHFIDDLLKWSVEFFEIEIPDQRIDKVYLSNLEIVLSKTLFSHIPTAKPLGEWISAYLSEYGLKHDAFEPTGFALNFDRTSLPGSILTNFSLQRRENTPFSSGIYFSSAPLKTKDHIALLQKLDS